MSSDVDFVQTQVPSVATDSAPVGAADVGVSLAQGRPNGGNNNDNDSSKKRAIIIGASVGGGVFVLASVAGVLVFLYIRRRRQQRRHTAAQSQLESLHSTCSVTPNPDGTVTKSACHTGVFVAVSDDNVKKCVSATHSCKAPPSPLSNNSINAWSDANAGTSTEYDIEGGCSSEHVDTGSSAACLGKTHNTAGAVPPPLPVMYSPEVMIPRLDVLRTGSGYLPAVHISTAVPLSAVRPSSASSSSSSSGCTSYRSVGSVSVRVAQQPHHTAAADHSAAADLETDLESTSSSCAAESPVAAAVPQLPGIIHAQSLTRVEE